MLIKFHSLTDRRSLKICETAQQTNKYQGIETKCCSDFNIASHVETAEGPCELHNILFGMYILGKKLVKTFFMN